MTAQEAKAQLRATVRQVLRQIPASIRQDCSRRVCGRLQDLPAWKNAAAVLFYSPLPDEIDISSLLKESFLAGKRVALPKFLPELNGYTVCELPSAWVSLARGKFGILEPGEDCPVVRLNQLDLILVPGVAFDMQGRRLGRGKGYYDRLLSNVHATKCGIAFDEQIQQELPAEPHDLQVNCLVTPARWLTFSPRAVMK